MKKIQNRSDYIMLLDAVKSTEAGDIVKGLHYNLALILFGFEVRTETREDAVRVGKQLLREYEKEHYK